MELSFCQETFECKQAGLSYFSLQRGAQPASRPYDRVLPLTGSSNAPASKPATREHYSEPAPADSASEADSDDFLAEASPFLMFVAAEVLSPPPAIKQQGRVCRFWGCGTGTPQAC